MTTRSATTTSDTATTQAIEQFEVENAEVMQALEVFGVAAAEYQRAMSALAPAVTHTGSSTEPEG